MKVREMLLLLALILIAGALAVALMQYGQKLADAIVIEFQREQDAQAQLSARDAMLHAYMYPDPIEVEIVGPLPQWVPDGQKYHVTRPGAYTHVVGREDER